MPKNVTLLCKVVDSGQILRTSSVLLVIQNQIQSSHQECWPIGRPSAFSSMDEITEQYVFSNLFW